MKITRFEVEGFRSLKRVVWQPGDLNVVIGPNGSGKSNLLLLLEMVSASARGRLAEFVLRSGGMGQLVWDGSAERIEFNLVATAPSPANGGGQYNYAVCLSRMGGTSSYRIDRESLNRGERREGAVGQPKVKLLERHGPKAELLDGTGHLRKATLESVPEEETLLSAAATPFTDGELRLYQSSLASWQIYQSLDVSRDAPLRRSVVSRFEENVDPSGQNLVSVLHTLYSGNREFKRDIDLAMRAAFGDDFEELLFPPASDQRIQLRVRWKPLKREQSSADLSDGLLRFLYLMAILANPSPPSLIAIDEPETGLHPYMLPIVAEYAADMANRSQVILTTHSAQLLDAFQDKKPVTTVTNWVGGETVLNTVSAGELDRWLKVFTLGSLFQSGALQETA